MIFLPYLGTYLLRKTKKKQNLTKQKRININGVYKTKKKKV